MLDYTIENQDIAISEEAEDEQEAFDTATVLAEDYKGRDFYIHLLGKPYAVVWWQDGKFHVKDIYKPVTATVQDNSIVIEEAAQNDEGDVVGSVEGVVHNDPDRVRNYLQSEKIMVKPSVLSSIQYPVAILKSMFVDEDARNQGHGTYLLEYFLAEAESHGANTVLLVPDVWEEQDIDLRHWYAGYGFDWIETAGHVPLMILTLNE